MRDLIYSSLNSNDLNIKFPFIILIYNPWNLCSALEVTMTHTSTKQNEK
jgi:hypothetical protein